MSSPSDDRGPVELLADEFLARCKRGERPTIKEYCDRHPEPADAKEWSQRLGDFDRTEYARAVDPETGEATGMARPKRAAVPYATLRVLATLPDYHAFVVRPGDTRPALVRLARAVPPPAKAATLLPVWDEVVVRWPETDVEAAPQGLAAGGAPGMDNSPPPSPAARPVVAPAGRIPRRRSLSGRATLHLVGGDAGTTPPAT